MSDSSSVQLFYVEETEWGVVPNDGNSPEGPPKLNEFRFNEDSLNQTTETTQSNEIRNDRNVADIIRTAVSAEGSVPIEASYGSHDDLFAGALADNWSTLVNEASVPASFTATSPGPGTFQSTTSPLLPSPNWFANVEVGQWLQIGNSAVSPSNDGYYKVVSVDAVAGTIVFDRAPVTDEPAGTFTVKGQFIKNGVTRKSFTIEKWFSDAVDDTVSPEEGVYEYFTGMRVGSMSLSISPGAVIEGELSFVGKQLFAVGATIGDGAPNTVSTEDVLNAVDNITDIRIDGEIPSKCIFTNFEFEVQNNLRAQPCIGSLANSGVGLGRSVTTGTIEAYLLDKSFLNKYLNFDTVSVSFRASLGGNNYIFDFPSVKFVTGATDTPGNDDDVLVAVDFNAKRDPDSGFAVAINRFAA